MAFGAEAALLAAISGVASLAAMGIAWRWRLDRRAWRAALAGVETEASERAHRCRNALQLAGALARLQAGAAGEPAVQAALLQLDQRQAAVSRALNLSLRRRDADGAPPPMTLADLGWDLADAAAAALRPAPYPAMRLAVIGACLSRPRAWVEADRLVIAGRPEAADGPALVQLLAESFGGETAVAADGELLVRAPVAALSTPGPA